MNHSTHNIHPAPELLLAENQRLRADLELLHSLQLLQQSLTQANTPAQIHETLAQDAPGPLQAQLALVCQQSDSGHWTAVAGPAGTDINQRADAVRKILHRVAQHFQTTPNTHPAPHPAATPSPPPDTLILPLQTATPQTTAPQSTARPTTTALYLESATPWTPRRSELASTLARHTTHCLQALAASPAGTTTTTTTSANSSDRQSPSFITRHKRRLQLAAALLTIALLPLQLKIPAAGILEPVQRQRLYAPESGIVTELPVTDGQAVQPGDILVRLRSDDLELQQAELLGALAESQARLSALETAAARGSATLNALSVESEQAELRARILSLEQQRTVLLRRIDSLVLRATTAGTVIGRDLQQRFIGRPLQRGQLLLDVVPAETSWHLQLEIAETDLRHVLRAFQNTPETPVSVSYFTETRPEQEHTTQLATIASAAELNSRGEWKTRVITSSVPLNTSERPGVGVQASVACGRRPLLYVLLRRAFDAARRTILLQGVY